MTQEDQNTATENAKYSAVRDASGKFITTQGRVPGSRNKATKASASAIQSLADTAFTKLKDLLEAGNPSIVEFVVKSLLPAGGRAVKLDTDGGEITPDMLVEAMASGTISPSEMRQIAVAMKEIRAVAELDALKARVDELDRLLKDSSI